MTDFGNLLPCRRERLGHPARDMPSFLSIGSRSAIHPLLRALEIAADIADDTDQPVTGRTQAIDEVRALSKHLDEIDSHRVLDDEWHTRRPRAV